jgi:hypothetical protein
MLYDSPNAFFRPSLLDRYSCSSLHATTQIATVDMSDDAARRGSRELLQGYLYVGLESGT